MKEVPAPQIEALLIDWTIDVLPTMDGAIFTFLALPWRPGQASEARQMAPLGLNLDSVRKLHADLGNLIQTMQSMSAQQPGTPGPGAH